MCMYCETDKGPVDYRMGGKSKILVVVEALNHTLIESAMILLTLGRLGSV